MAKIEHRVRLSELRPRRRPSGSAAAPSAASGTRSSRRWRRDAGRRARVARARQAAPIGDVRVDDAPRMRDAASASSIACSAAAWCRARWCCSAAIPASASRRCCCRRSTGWRARARRCSTSRARSRCSRPRCAPSGSACDARDAAWCWPRPSSSASSTRPTRCKPAVLAVDSIQTVHSAALESIPGSLGQVREAAGRLLDLRQDHGRAGDPRRPRHQGRRARRAQDARARGRRGALLRGRARRTAIASCARPRTASARPTRSACSRCAPRGWPRWPTRRRCSSPSGRWARRARWWWPSVEGSRPILVEIQALVAQRGGHAATDGARHRSQPRLAPARGDRAARRHRRARAGRVRQRRRRRAARPSRRAISASWRRWRRRRAAGRSIRTRCASARSASPARCARSAGAELRLAEATKLGFRRCVLPELSALAAPRHAASSSSSACATSAPRSRRCSASATWRSRWARGRR